MPRFRLAYHSFSFQFTFFGVACACAIIFQKNVFNENAVANAAFAASPAAYMVALSTLFLIAVGGFIHRSDLRRIPKSVSILSILFLYLYALVTSPISTLPIVSLFRGFSGIGLVLVAIAYGNYLVRRNTELFLKQIFSFISIMALSIIIGTIMFSVNVYGASIFPIRAGNGAVLVLFLALWKWIDFRTTRKFSDLAFTLFLLAFGSALNSVSAIVALLMALICLLAINGRFIAFSLITALVIVGFMLFFSYLNSNIDSVVFNKPARAYLIGTGRFPLYEYALNVYLNEISMLRQFVGVGFMAEREYLIGSQLSWTSNLHNSLLSNLLGLGVIGSLISFLYVFAPFFSVKKFRETLGVNITNKWIGMHLMFLFFGLSSIDYPNSPGWLLVSFITFTAGLTRLHFIKKRDA